MSRLAATLLGLGGIMLAAAAAPAAPPAGASPVTVTAVDQSGWAARKQFVRLPNGVRLAYVEMGDPAGAPLLLLHGFTDSSRSWTIVAPYLSGHRLIIPDQRGHGASDAPLCCYGPSVLADDARLLLDALGIRRAAVAGHSLGSMVALALAADHPDRVSRMALIGSTGLPPVQRGDWFWTNVADLTAIDTASPFMRDWVPANQPTPVDPAFAGAATPEIFATPLHVWRAIPRELAALPIARHAADVTAPALILSGAKDPLFPAEHHAALVRALPKAEAVVVPDVGHNLIWERPATIGPLLARFFEADRGGTSAR